MTDAVPKHCDPALVAEWHEIAAGSLSEAGAQRIATHVAKGLPAAARAAFEARSRHTFVDMLVALGQRPSNGAMRLLLALVRPDAAHATPIIARHLIDTEAAREPELLFGIGIVCAELDRAVALAALGRCVALAPDHRAAHLVRMTIARNAGDADVMIASAKAVLDDPGTDAATRASVVSMLQQVLDASGDA